jgi:hypothetical protein
MRHIQTLVHCAGIIAATGWMKIVFKRTLLNPLKGMTTNITDIWEQVFVIAYSWTVSCQFYTKSLQKKRSLCL